MSTWVKARHHFPASSLHLAETRSGQFTSELFSRCVGSKIDERMVTVYKVLVPWR